MMMQQIHRHPLLMRIVLLFLTIITLLTMISAATSKKAKATVTEIVPVGDLVPIISTAAEKVIALFDSLGIIDLVGDAVYVISQGYSYLLDFIDCVNPFGITVDELVDFFVKFIPDDLYFWDEETAKPYVATGEGYRIVKAGDLYLSAKDVANTQYSLPVNVLSVCGGSASYNGSVRFTAVQYGTDPFSKSFDVYVVGIQKLQSPKIKKPVYVGSSYAWTYNGAGGFEVHKWFPDDTYVSTVSLDSAWTGGTVWGKAPDFGNYDDYMTENGAWVVDSSGTWYQIAGKSPYIYDHSNINIYGTDWIYDGAYIDNPYDSSSDFYNYTQLLSTCLLTKGEPVVKLSDYLPALGNGVDLGDGVVNVPVPPSDMSPDQDYVQPPPQFWEFFKTLADALANSGGQTNVNNNTTLGDFVNNNYNYNEVNVNLPDIPNHFIFEVKGIHDINANINVDGSLGINHGGSVTINVDVDKTVSLPAVTSSDGEGIYNMDAADVVGALTTHNPVMPTIKTLLDSIDPTLRALFVTGVAFLMILGIWHLVRW